MFQDFTLKTYKTIIEKLIEKGFQFQTFEEFAVIPAAGKVCILRHDVDRAPKNSVKMAAIEKSLGIKASYYFRIVSESYDEASIKAVLKYGHELGYHYEDLSLANGDKEKALSSFIKNLEMFRNFYPIKTMCMHGSPVSKYDNRLLWEAYDYKKYGIIAEPYFDLNFNEVFYITDASRSWNNRSFTIRDKVKSDFQVQIRNSKDIIKLAEANLLPIKIMLSTHPHNWTDNILEWIKIRIWQGLKNQVKRIIVNKS